MSRSEHAPLANPSRRAALRRLFALSLCSILPAVAVAQEPRPGAESELLTLGPGLLTFPEIARALSTKDQPIACVAQTQHRAAFVYLKNRSRADIIRLLADALDIEIRPATEVSEGRALVLDENALLARRELRWRRTFAENIRAMLDQQRTAPDRYAGWTPEQVEQRIQELNAEIERSEANGSPVKPARAHEMGQELFALGRWQERRTGDAEQRLIAEWGRRYFNSIPFAQAMETSYITVANALDTLPRDLVEAAIAQNHASGASIPAYDFLGLAVELRREINSLQVNVGLRLLSTKSPRWIPLELAAEITVSYRPEGVARAVFAGFWNEAFFVRGLGREAEAWLAGEEDATRAFLATEAAGAPLADPKRTEGDALSVWIAAYQKERNAEVIMEVWPHIEYAKTTLQGPASHSLRALAQAVPSWTFRQSGDVLVVKNQMAFLDRVPARPAGALVELLRVARNRPAPTPPRSANGKPPMIAMPGGSGELYFKPWTPLPRGEAPLYLKDINAYSKAARRLALWTAPTSSHNTFWGVRLDALDNTLAGVCLYEKLTEEERAALRKKQMLSLAKVDASALREASAVLTRFASANLPLTVVDGVAALQRGRLYADFTIQIPEMRVVGSGARFMF